MFGYSKNLYVLPFDHRSSFLKTFFGSVKKITPAQSKLICQYKQIIFDAFLLATKKVKAKKAVPAILVDEEFGLAILKSARRQKITFLLPVEKSGQAIFDFAHGRNFGLAIKKLQPTIVKALVRSNPALVKDNKLQLPRLATLSAWCQKNHYPLMVELLVPPTATDLKKCQRQQNIYDQKLRPRLTVETIKNFQAAGIEPDIWKIEALEKSTDWPKIIHAVRSTPARQNVSIVMLGRGESFAKVKKWMDVAPKNKLNGFAVGRTVFLQPLIDLHSGLLSKQQTIQQIAKNYLELVGYWQK